MPLPAHSRPCSPNFAADRDRALHAPGQHVEHAKANATVVDQHLVARPQYFGKNGRPHADVGGVAGRFDDQRDVIAGLEDAGAAQPGHAKLRALKVGDQRERRLRSS